MKKKIPNKNQVRQHKHAGWDAEKDPRPLFKTLEFLGKLHAIDKLFKI